MAEQRTEKGVLQCFTAIGQLAPFLGIEIAVDKATKVFRQIASISQ